MSQKLLEKDLAPEGWSNDGEFVHCKHDDCHYYNRHKGQRRRLLARFYPDRVEFKCDSCGQKSSYKFTKELVQKSIDEHRYVSLNSLIKEWETVK
jgi:uncharacterized UBP type Zn finger protein